MSLAVAQKPQTMILLKLNRDSYHLHKAQWVWDTHRLLRLINDKKKSIDLKPQRPKNRTEYLYLNDKTHTTSALIKVFERKLIEILCDN